MEEVTIDAQELTRGLMYGHYRANANTAAVHEAHSTVQAVVELLEERGLLSREALEARKQAAAEPLRRQYLERGMSVALQDYETSKYEFTQGTKIDCKNRLHLCKASCCRLGFALSSEDVEEGIVKWDLGRPYTIAQGKTGYCTHCDPKTRSCAVYEHRPVVCRAYDCRNDKRIWLDFEKHIINPQLSEPDWPQCVSAEPGAVETKKACERKDASAAVSNKASGAFRRIRLPVLRVQRSGALREERVSTPSDHGGSEKAPPRSRWLIGVRRRRQQRAGHVLLHPKHLNEIRGLIAQLERTGSEDTNHIRVLTTSRGVKIAANQYLDGEADVAHFSLSREGGGLDEATAAMLGQFMARSISPGGEAELVVAEGGAFHLLVHTPRSEPATGPS